MKIHIIAVGTKMPSWVQQGYGEYAKRLPKELTPNVKELPLANRSKSTSVARVKQLESESILQALPEPCRVIALHAKGKGLSTEHMSKKLAQWQMNGMDIALLIGGPDGLSDACLARADELWSLSAMTLPHPLVRIVLIEQLYRSWTILQRHPYHK